MSLKDYIHEFQRTCISANQVLEEGTHYRVPYHFNIEKQINNTHPAFFRLYLEEDIDLSKETLAISVHQKGNRL